MRTVSRVAFGLFGAIAVLVIIYTIFGRSPSEQTVSRETFVSDARAGIVDRVRISASEKSFAYTTRTDDVTYRVDNEAEVPVREILSSAGIEDRSIDAIRISQDSRGAVQRIARIVLAFLPITLVLAVAGYFGFRRKRPRSVDPVCGVKLKRANVAPRSVFQDVPYAFCSPEHKAQFDADPVRYLLKA